MRTGAARRRFRAGLVTTGGLNSGIADSINFNK
jgi:hypothetical protein